MKKKALILFLGIFMIPFVSKACSILYYVDAKTGKIYVVNSEDYFLNVDAYIQIESRSKKKLARLWYGWDKFAQGGINEKGLFFDAAVTPDQKKVKGYRFPKGNFGDKLLAHCSTVEEALAYLEKKKVALTNSHMMFGDRSGNAVIVEWVDGVKKLHWKTNNRLLATNFLLSDPSAGNYPCPRFESIENRIIDMEKSDNEITLMKVGNTFAQVGQVASKIENDRLCGTVYTSFIDVTEGKFFLSYKLSNENVIKLDLNEEFAKKRCRKIELKD